MAPDLNSLPPSRSPISANGIDRRQPNPPSPRSGSFSLAAAATINAGIQQQDSRHSSASSRSNTQPNQPGRSERRRSNVAMNLNLNDPSMPAPGEFQHSDRRPSIGHQFRTSSPQSMGSPTTAPPHHRAPSLGELHQELEQEQEAQVCSGLRTHLYEQSAPSVARTAQFFRTFPAIVSTVTDTEPRGLTGNTTIVGWLASPWR
ncbi:MAG: hypothetical protein Q9222_003778 [Ikaeria aurantiellina]